MVKAVDRGMRIEGIRLVEKTGGKLRPIRRRRGGAVTLIAVDEALRRVLDGADAAAGRRRCRSPRAHGRVLAADCPRPPHPAAVRRLGHGRLCRARADVATPPARLRLIGDVAGRAAVRRRGWRRARRCASSPARRCPRAPTPSSCRRMHRATATPSLIVAAPHRGRHIRRRGLDFAAGPRCCCRPGARLDRPRSRPCRGDEPPDAAGAPPAARGAPRDRRRTGAARRRSRPRARSSPRTAYARRRAGAPRAPRSSTSASCRTGWRRPSAAVQAAHGLGADVLVTTGGASVGEHDLVQPGAAGATASISTSGGSRCGPASR